MIAVAELVALARGGTADVFVARAAGERVIVKVPHASALVAGEARILAAVPAGIAPRLLGITQVAGRDALVLEHVALPTLRAARTGSVELVARCRLAAAICDAVATLHAAGLVHGDLAPDNVLVALAPPAARLIDFAGAAAIGAPMPPSATLAYAAPERMTACCIAGPALDVYALATLCFELLAESHPFGDGGERRIGHAARRPPRLAERGVACAALEEDVADALAKDPARRPSARALATAFAAARPVLAAASSAPRAAADVARLVVLVGCSWSVEAACIAAVAHQAGGVVAHTARREHVIALGSSEARARAQELARKLAQHGAERVVCREATITIGAHGIPRGAAIRELAGELATAPRHDPREALATSAPPEVALIGRDDVLATIAAAVAEARAGRPALVAITGEPGQGKSHLARTLRDHHADLDRLELCAPDAATLRAALGCAALPPAATPEQARGAAARSLAAALIAARPRLLVIDDAHATEPVVLDAIELAVRRETAALAVVLLARPALLATRPRCGAGAAWSRRLVLGPLAPDAGRALVRALLPPDAVVPGTAIDRVIARCGGVPLYIRELVGAILRADRRRGAAPATRGALPTDLVDAAPEAGLLGWLVDDELAVLSPGAREAAAALALRGTALAAADARHCLDALGDGLDPGVAIAELVAAGLLVATGGGLRFRHDLVRDAIERGLGEVRRAALHARLLAVASDAATRARHAEGCGRRDIATAAWTDVAAAARARHDDLGEELALGRALACGDESQLALLHHRGAARARLGRHDAAAEDFARAATLARDAGDRAALADVLLDEALAFDWALHHAAAAACVGEATALVADDDPAERRARLALAVGRTAWRAGDPARALAPLRRALALAEPLGDRGYATSIAARLMLGFLLASCGDLAEASAVLDGTLALATVRGDLVHVAAAHCNRYPVHAARGDLAAARADLAAFAAAGRELGNTVTAYRGELYLALVALWIGDDAGAHHHAIAAHRLEAEDPALLPRPRAALVLGELAARAGDRAEAARWHHHARGHGTADTCDRIGLATLARWLAGELDLGAARELAVQAVAAGEPEAAYQILELCARSAPPSEARAARRDALALVPRLPRFVAPAALEEAA